MLPWPQVVDTQRPTPSNDTTCKVSAHLDSSDFGMVSLGMDITLDVRLSTEFGLKLPSE